MRFIRFFHLRIPSSYESSLEKRKGRRNSQFLIVREELTNSWILDLVRNNARPGHLIYNVCSGRLDGRFIEVNKNKSGSLMDHFQITRWSSIAFPGPSLAAITMPDIEGTKACTLWLGCTRRVRPREPTKPQTHCRQPVADWLTTPSSGVTVEIPVLASWTIGEYNWRIQHEAYSFCCESC